MPCTDLDPSYSAAQRCKEAATGGDPFELFQAIVDAPFLEIDFDEQFARLHRLLAEQAKADPLAFAQQIIDHGLSVIGYLSLRVEYFLAQRLNAADRTCADRKTEEVPADAVEKLLPKLMDMHRYLSEMALTRATLARQIELARAKKRENDLAEGLQAAKTASVSPDSPALTGIVNNDDDGDYEDGGDLGRDEAEESKSESTDAENKPAKTCEPEDCNTGEFSGVLLNRVAEQLEQ